MNVSMELHLNDLQRKHIKGFSDAHNMSFIFFYSHFKCEAGFTPETEAPRSLVERWLVSVPGFVRASVKQR